LEKCSCNKNTIPTDGSIFFSAMAYIKSRKDETKQGGRGSGALFFVWPQDLDGQVKKLSVPSDK
jgi:hypothetical protein